MKKAVVTIISPILPAPEDRIEARRRLLTDWAGLVRYGSENTELQKPTPGEDRVVFPGDEITERYGQ